MALVTVQRSPSPSGSAETEEQEVVDADDSNLKSPRQRRRRSKSALKKLRKLFTTIRFVTKLKPCESYFTVKGAALILPQSDYEGTYARKQSKSQGDIQNHLQTMFSLLRPMDTIKVAVKLEGSHTRYLAVVSCIGRQDTEESVILGINLREKPDKPEIGLILPIWAHTKIELDGDGGFSIKYDHQIHIFKPVSVQAMWSALQSLNKVVRIAMDNLYIPRGLTHTWMGFYEAKLCKDTTIISEWNVLTDIDSSYRIKTKMDEIGEKKTMHRSLSDSSATYNSCRTTIGSQPLSEEEFIWQLKTELKLVMMTVDLEEATCRYVRECLQTKLGMDLMKYRVIIELQMFEIMGQMDAPTKILDYLYLGSEWNASNLEELQHNGVQYILNISREIDNFFTGILLYMNIREWDVEQTNLMPYWEDTYKFINKARKRGSKTLVHCKMGISRSASTVIAYLMKENKWSLKKAHEFTKSKRSIINPNSGFWKQLETYEGILKASWNRESFERKADHATTKNLEKVPEDLDYNSAEDMLAVRLGKDFPESSDLPFLHTEQDIEIGSRSADSTEDSFPDQLSPDATGKTSGKAKKKKMPRLDSNVAESGDYISSDSSDLTDSDSLTSDSDDEDKLFQPIDIPGTSGEGQDRKRVAKPKGRRVKSESDKSLLIVDEASIQEFSREGSVSKFKPDGSWIKTEQEEKEERSDENKAEEGGECSVKDTQGEVDDSPVYVLPVKPETTQLESGQSEQKAVSENISTDRATDVDRLSDMKRNEKEADTSPTDHPGGSTETDTETKEEISQEDSKGLEPYVKENIPWNPGTVRKQKQDLEEKYGTVAQRKSDTTPSVDKTNKGDDSDKDGTPTADKTIEAVVTETVTQIVEQTVNKEEEGQSEVTDSSVGDTDLESTKSKKTVYDLEEINLPEGIVRKTMMEIEQRNRLSEKESPRKRLQRSSSLKSSRVTPKAKDRDNERRKTCIAILSPSYIRSESNQSTGDQEQASTETDHHDKANITDPDQLEAAHLQASGDEEGDGVKNQTGTVKIYKYMGEELTVQEGLVRKQTLDIEHKAKETTSKQTAVKQEKQTELYSSPTVLSEASKQISPTSTEETNQAVLSNAATNVSVVTDKTSNKNDAKHEKLVDESPIVTVEDIKHTLYDGGKKSADVISDDQSSKESVPSLAEGKRSKSLGSRPGSCFDSETLQLIREIGSALMNSPAKCEIDDKDEKLKGESLVNHYVRKIEKTTKLTKSKKKSKIEIVIIEKEKASGSEQSSAIPTTEQQQKHICDSNEIKKESSSNSPIAVKKNISPQSVVNASPKPEGKNSSPKWNPVTKKELLFDHCDTTEKHTHDKVTDKPNNTEHKTPPDSSGSDSQLSTGTQAQGDSNTDLEELSETETCSVKNLVGIFTAKSGGSSPPSTPSDQIVNAQAVSTDTTDGKLTRQGSKGCVTSPPRQDRPVLKHRQSEPVISLSENSLLMFSKAVGGFGHVDRGILCEGRDPDNAVECRNRPQQDPDNTVECRESKKEDRPQRPKSVGHLQDSQGASGVSRRPNLRQSQTLSECEGSQAFSWEGKKLKTKKTYGKSHPLAKLESRNSMDSIRNNPFYNTM